MSSGCFIEVPFAILDELRQIAQREGIKPASLARTVLQHYCYEEALDRSLGTAHHKNQNDD